VILGVKAAPAQGVVTLAEAWDSPPTRRRTVLIHDRTRQAVRQLEQEWPDWQCWVVHRAVGSPVWCARRWDDTGQVLNEDSPERLAEGIRRAEAGPG
jgi:hypothetical protein